MRPPHRPGEERAKHRRRQRLAAQRLEPTEAGQERCQRVVERRRALVDERAGRAVAAHQAVVVAVAGRREHQLERRRRRVVVALEDRAHRGDLVGAERRRSTAQDHAAQIVGAAEPARAGGAAGRGRRRGERAAKPAHRRRRATAPVATRRRRPGAVWKSAQHGPKRPRGSRTRGASTGATQRGLARRPRASSVGETHRRRRIIAEAVRPPRPSRGAAITDDAWGASIDASAAPTGASAANGAAD
jgi:hypothetical protein